MCPSLWLSVAHCPFSNPLMTLSASHHYSDAAGAPAPSLCFSHTPVFTDPAAKRGPPRPPPQSPVPVPATGFCPLLVLKIEDVSGLVFKKIRRTTLSQTLRKANSWRALCSFFIYPSPKSSSYVFEPANYYFVGFFDLSLKYFKFLKERRLLSGLNPRFCTWRLIHILWIKLNNALKEIGFQCYKLCQVLYSILFYISRYR